MTKVRKRLLSIRNSLQPTRDPNLELQEHAYISKSITVKEFREHFNQLTEEDADTKETELTEQFKQLAHFSPDPPSTHPENYVAAGLQYNRRKNRYFNILPCKDEKTENY
jgi:hypothetical protein